MLDIDTINEQRIYKNIEQWKSKLLDFSKRNNLIYFKYRKNLFLKIDESCEKLYDFLINKPKIISLEELKTPYDMEDCDSKKEFDKLLTKLRTKANLTLKEKGINTLYLCLGMLKWRESDSSDIDIYSPLVLLPVRLIKTSKKEPFILLSDDKEVINNNSLMYKLKMDFEINIYDEDTTIDDINNFFEKTKKSIRNMKNWDIEYCAFLGNFTFSKVSMYKDLERYENNIFNHKIVRKLAGFEQVYSEDEIERIDNTPLEKKSEKIYQVLDADSSQQKVIEISKKGYSFVIEGPPGTGKSQTITNIISEAMAQGKSVLFVSEKVAALDVVAKRLNSVGLGNYILELHSNKANKKEIITNIFSQYVRQKDCKGKNNDLFFNELDIATRHLDDYVSELHKKHNPLDMNAFQLHGHLAKLNNVSDINSDFCNLEDITMDCLVSIRNLFKDLESKHDNIIKYKESLWKSISLDECSLQNQKQICELLDRLVLNVNRLLLLKNDFSVKYGIDVQSIKDIICIKNCIDKLNKDEIYNKAYFDVINFKMIEDKIESNEKGQEEYNRYLNDLTNIYNNIDGFQKIDTQKFDLKSLKLILGNNIVNKLYSKKDRLKLIKQINILTESVSKLKQYNNFIFDVFGKEIELSLKQYKTICKILDILQKGEAIPAVWLQDIEKLKNLKYKVLITKKEQITQLKLKIRKVEHYYKPDIYMKDRLYLIGISNLLKENESNQRAKKLYEFPQNHHSDFDDFENQIKRVIDISKELFNKLDIGVQINIDSIKDILNLVKIKESMDYINPSWFEENKLLIINNKIGSLKKHINKISELKNEINSIFDITIFKLQYKDIYDRFATEYSGIFKIFNANYKRDKKSVERCLKDGVKSSSYEDIMHNLNKLIIYDMECEDFKKNEDEYLSIFGPLMNGIDTDINLIENTTNNFKEYLEYWNKYGQPEGIAKFATGSITKKEVLDLATLLKSELYRLEAFISDISGFYDENVNYDKVELVQIYKMVESNNKDINKILHIYDDISKITNDSNIEFNVLAEIIEDSIKINKKLEELDNENERYKQLLGENYNGIDTNWEKVDSELEFALKISELKEVLSIKEYENVVGYVTDIDHYDRKEIELINIELSENILLIDSESEEFNIIDNIESIPQNKLQSILNIIISALNNIDTTIEYIEPFRKQKFDSFDEFLGECKLINHFIETRRNIFADSNECSDLFGERYKAENTDWNVILNEYLNIKNVITIFEQNHMKLSPILINCIIDRNKRIELIENCDLVKYYYSNKNIINEFLNLQRGQKFYYRDTELSDINFHELIDILNKLKNQVEDINYIISINKIIDRSKKYNLDKFMIAAVSDVNIKDDYLKVFNKRLYVVLLDRIYEQSEILKSFDKESYINILKEFKDYDEMLIELNKNRIKNVIDTNIEENLNTFNNKKESNFLCHENGKKKKHVSIRTLFSAIPNLLKLLKPCIMMSPLSVSEYIDLNNVSFDLVIFDEASQICPEDAIGSMLRGEQIIIAGDKKQLPPTKFFDVSSDDNNEYDVEESDDLLEETDFESILDLASSYMVSEGLLWHYRSRHESLIAFSNKNFYNNSLYTFPSSQNNKNLGVKFDFVQGLYNESGSSTNLLEAKRVAKLVIEHYQKMPEKSLGVITFGSKQMNCIAEMVEEERKKYPELDCYFDDERDDCFFIKNLENVQGDERDTIILSVCYGYSDESRKKLNHNFGPLNKAGGERRLNVAITRAKYQLILVSSITDSDIDLSRTNSVGVKLLKEFLHFARTGELEDSITVSSQLTFDSPLEEDVYDELSKLGYEINTQVGCSGYRIDLAIKKPDRKGDYILGIECDGATYHSSKSARDRDRLRQEVLEGLGWKIHRIWSQDWFKNKYREISKIKSKVEELS